MLATRCALQVFSTTGETGRLDRTDRRYAWFKRQLRGKEEVRMNGNKMTTAT